MSAEIASRSQTAPLMLPFLSGSALTNLRWAVLLTPLWYLIGLDQFLWPFLVFYLAALYVLYRARRGAGIVVTPIARLGVLFLAVQAFSGLFIIEDKFYVVFARNLSLWGGGLLVHLIITNALTRRRQVLRLLWSWTLVLLAAGVAGVIAFALNEGFEFRTLILYIVPQSMRTGVTAGTVWTRSFLAEPAPIGGRLFFRVRSFFLYANSYAGVLAIAIPLMVYLGQQYRSRDARWWVVHGTLAISVLALALTTSRAAIIGLAAGTGFFFIHRTRRADRIVWTIALLVATAAALAFVLITPDLVFDTGATYLEGFATAKGRSLSTRSNIAYYSIISWLERPAFGWGTPRDMSIYGFSPNYPRLGSHSQFLSVLYRHGIVGLFVFLALLAALWRRFGKVPEGDWRARFRPYLYWAFTANVVHAVLIQLDIDFLFMFLVWQLWALIDALPRYPAVPELHVVADTGEAA